MLGHALAPIMALEAHSVEEIVLVVGHLGELIEPWYRERYDRPLHIAVQSALDGQAGAIARVGDRLDGPVLILFCDTLHDADIGALAALGDSVDAPDGVLHVKPVLDPSRFGVAVVHTNGYVKQLVEKPTRSISTLAIVGVYWIKDGRWLARAVETLLTNPAPAHGEYYLADALQIMIDEGARFEARRLERWLDCGTMESLRETDRILQSERAARASASFTR